MHCCLWFRSVFRVRGPWPKRYGYHLSIIYITRYTHQRRCLAQIATKGSCMPNLRGIPGKPWRPIASTSNNYYYLAHAQRMRRSVTEKAPLIAAVARRTTWSKLWDCALDIGSKSVKGLQNLSRVMSHHGFGNHPCPLCDTAPLPTSVLDHLLDCHSSSLFLSPTPSSDGLIELLEQLHLGVLCNFSKLYTF